ALLAPTDRCQQWHPANCCRSRTIMTDAWNRDGAPDSCADAFILPDASKLEAMAEFAAGAGHEINNPLATIIGRAQQLLKDETNPQRRQMLASIGAQAYRIRDMIGDAMLFARPPVAEPVEVNLATAVQHVAARLAEEFSSGKCVCRIEIGES